MWRDRMPTQVRRQAAEVSPPEVVAVSPTMRPATVRRKPRCSAKRKSASTTAPSNVPRETSEFPVDSLRTAAGKPAAEVLYAVKSAGGGFATSCKNADTVESGRINHTKLCPNALKNVEQSGTMALAKRREKVGLQYQFSSLTYLYGSCGENHKYR
jgi:hypothetical protein